MHTFLIYSKYLKNYKCIVGRLKRKFWNTAYECIRHLDRIYAGMRSFMLLLLVGSGLKFDFRI